MIKIASLIAIFVSCGVMGVIKSWDLKERINLLEEFSKFIMDVESRISYFREPLPVILSVYEKTGENKVSKMINGTLTQIEDEKGSFGQLWALNVESVYMTSPLTKEDLETIKYAGTFIGQTDYDNQKIKFDYLKRELEDRIEDAKKMYKEKGTMHKKIGFFCGGLVLLIFL